MKKVYLFVLTLLLAILAGSVAALSAPDFARFKSYDEVQAWINSLQKANPGLVSLHTIATSPGGRAVTVIEISAGSKQAPAIFTGANFEGITPISTEGALRLAQMVIDSAGYRSAVKWFIMPLPNPDAMQGYFLPVKWERCVNDLNVNDDTDDQTNEDGPDDLNGDGMITQMRVEDPEGSYIVSAKDTRIMVKADPKKGERGKYKLYTEGIDNDGDGAYNEDGPGGINVGVGFPHLFRLQNKESGLWPGESPENYGIMNFMFSHPEIAMVFTLGTSDWCAGPPRNNRSGGANLESLKIPARFATRFGADPDKTYTMTQVMEMFRSFAPGGGGREISPEMIAGFLGLGAVVNPLDDDMRFYTELSDKYKDYLKKKGFTTDRQAAEPDKDGSFETWAYYHLGVPSFAMNLFTVPKPKDEKPKESSLSTEEAEKMSPDEFIALGEEKISAFLKSQNAPERMNAARVIDMMKSGRFTPKQLLGMMKNMPQPPKAGELDEKEKNLLGFTDKYLGGKGFVPWQPVKHPDFVKAEVGGFVPFLAGTPPPAMVDSLCKVQIPWLLNLSRKLPEISLMKEEITPLGAGVFKLELFFENKGYLPWPIAMGTRNRQPAPVVVTLEGQNFEFLEGFSRTPLGEIGGNQVKKLTWLLKTEKKTEITAIIESAVFGNSVKQINIGG